MEARTGKTRSSERWRHETGGEEKQEREDEEDEDSEDARKNQKMQRRLDKVISERRNKPPHKKGQQEEHEQVDSHSSK